MNTKLAVGIATMGTIKTRTLFSLVQLFKKNEANLITWEGCNVHQSRTNIVRTALKNDITHLLFVDSDMVFEPDALNILLEKDKDIIGANYNMRKFPLTSTIKIHDEKGVKIYEPKSDMFECYAVSTGFMLIKMDVFKKIPTPWFAYEFDEKGDMKTGSDIWFCKQARKAGYKIYCDPTIQVGHIGDYVY